MQKKINQKDPKHTNKNTHKMIINNIEYLRENTFEDQTVNNKARSNQTSNSRYSSNK